MPASEPDGVAASIREAYNQGYEDGVAGLERRPPNYIAPEPLQAATSGGGGGGFGIWSLMRYGMIANYVYRIGTGPGGWNPQVAFANAKANPLQAFLMLSMISGGGLPFF